MITATVRNYLDFTGLENELFYSSGELANSPAIQELVNLAIGDTIITVPVVSGFVVHGVLIVPPALNVEEPVLKGAVADVGIPLSANQVSIFHFGAVPPTLLYLESATVVDGFRLVWF